MSSYSSKYYFQRYQCSEDVQNILDNVKEFCESEKTIVYVLDSPLADSTANNKNGFVLLTPKHKICFVQTGDDGFEEFVEDITDDLAYISKKHGYEPIIGRKREWEKLTKQLRLSDLKDFRKAYENDFLVQDKNYRRIDVLISLFIGCINQANKILVDEPDNLIDKIKYKIQIFDTDQTRFIYDELPLEQDIVSIQGLSGTGKTELLLHKMKDTYLANEDDKIVFTCHNKVLANTLRDRIKVFFNDMKVDRQIDWGERLWCFNAWGSQSDPDSGLFSMISNHYEVPFYSYRECRNFDAACRLMINNLKKKFGGSDIKEEDKLVDYIFIDESQDFEENFIKLCRMVCRKRVYVAGDVFQSIFEERTASKLQSDYLLSRCYRTDPKTLMFAQGLGMGLFEDKKLSWMEKDKWELCGYSVDDKTQKGKYILTREPIRRFEDLTPDYNSLEIIETINLKNSIISSIKNLKLEYPNLEPSDICIIFLDIADYVYEYDSRIGREIQHELGWDYVLAHEKRNIEAGKVVITTRNHVKGLEFPFVFCVTSKITREHSFRNAVYTMLSRSFLRSYLVVAKNDTNGLTQDMKKGKVHIMEHKNMIVSIPSETEIADIKREFEVSKLGSKSLRERCEIIMNTLKITQNLWSELIESVESTAKSRHNISDSTLKKLIEANYELLNQ